MNTDVRSSRSPTRPPEVRNPTQDSFVVCCDLDGVVWRGDEPIEPAVAGIAELRAAGVRLAYVSNNGSQPIGELVDKLVAMGVPAEANDVVTSATSAAALLAGSLARDARVLAYAGPGVTEALGTVGLRPVDRPPADAVVVGFHPEFDYEELDFASRVVRDGARFVVTGLDATYPVPGGLLPGSGAIAAAVAVASGRQPEVAGKPERAMVSLVRERFGTMGIMIGDRPSSDGVFAAALGWPFALVLSGIAAHAPQDGEEPVPDPRPPFLGADLGALVPELLRAVPTSAGA
jgi:glycerol-1-phosphatase